MFSRTPRILNRGKQQETDSTPRRDPKIQLDPVDELSYLFDRLSYLIDSSRKTNEIVEQINATASPRGANIKSLLFRKKSRSKDEDEITSSITESSTNAPMSTEHTSPPPVSAHLPSEFSESTPSNKHDFSRREEKYAKYVEMDEDECVEIIRRIAELVVIGERVVANQQYKQERRMEIEKKFSWGDEIVDEKEFYPNSNVWDDEPFGSEKYLPIFETFFERNGLALLVDLVTGVSFIDSGELSKDSERPINLDLPTLSTQGNNDGNEIVTEGEEKEAKGQTSGSTLEHLDRPREQSSVARLPPIRIATQAIQSLAILVQNVSKATSLYFILSNNLINELIEFPLELYTVAERQNQSEDSNDKVKLIATAELGELTTHFVTFLKSLALRMNAETLQFFLKYPNSTAAEELKGGQIASGGSPNNIKIEFPLYARALDFCAATHDSMVRLTAMNICLNTLRLTTVVPDDDAVDDNGEHLGSSPDGVLHNAQPLPFRERLAIAQHICAPERVERLVSPIFAKLAALWSSLEEIFLSCESEDNTSNEETKPNLPKRNKTSFTEQSLRNVGADIQDQLLVLEDLLKVGLTALNEQVIEMMLATFVYPLLLQPLLHHFGRMPSSDIDVVLSEDPFSTCLSAKNASPRNDTVVRPAAHVIAPAKTAFFTLASVFQFITNRPLLRLLLTALFHPLAPDSSSETKISPEACVTYTNDAGQTIIRVDDESLNDGSIESATTTYPFGAGAAGVEPLTPTSGRCCIFILAPSLAEVLNNADEKMVPHEDSPLNPYRKAIMQSLRAPHFMCDVKRLAVSAIDAALLTFDSKYTADMLRSHCVIKLSSQESSQKTKDPEDEDVSNHKTKSIDATTKIDFPNVVVSVAEALCDSVMNISQGPFGTWKLQFDAVAAHSLLCLIWREKDALDSIAARIQRRWQQSAMLYSEIPPRIPTVQHLGAIVHSMFYEMEGKSLVEELLMLEKIHKDNGSWYTEVSCIHTFDDLCARAVELPPASLFSAYSGLDEGAVTEIGVVSARSLIKLDALSTLLSDLASTDGDTIRDVSSPVGLVFSPGGALVDFSSLQLDFKRKIYSSLSCQLWGLLTDSSKQNTPNTSHDLPKTGSSVVLTGVTALPCVCESKNNDPRNGAKIVAGGIIWQSLYLIFKESYMILAAPGGPSAGPDGRVVSAASLARMAVEKDKNPPMSAESTARRLLVHYEWFGDDPPPQLFHFVSTPKDKKFGNFSRVKMWRSSLDIWFEDEKACDHAFHSFCFKISTAKTRRGDEVLDYLSDNQL